MRRIWLVVMAGGFALAGITAFMVHYYAQPTVLKIAVGPAKSDDTRLIGAISGQLGRDRAPVRLRVVEKAGPEEAAAAIDKGEADLAVTRRDLAMPTTGQAVAILRRQVVVIMAMPGAGIEKISDLAGRKIGVIGRGRSNFALLETILLQYDIHQVHAVPIDPDDIGAGMRDGIEVIFATGSLTGRNITEAVALVSRDGAPKFLTIDESEAIAQRHAVYEFEGDRGRRVRGIEAGRNDRDRRLVLLRHGSQIARRGRRRRGGAPAAVASPDLGGGISGHYPHRGAGDRQGRIRCRPSRRRGLF